MEVCVDLVLCTVHLLPDGDVAPSLRGLHAPRAAIDLLQLSHMCWDVELQRNKSAEPLCCLLKLPPLVGNDGMCSGAIARVRPTGQVEVMCSTNVNVALQVALYARHYLRRLLHKMDQPNVEMRRVLRAVHHADQLHMEEVVSNDDEEEQDPTMVDDEMMAPRVVLCNAVLHPQVEELRQLREEHFGMKEEVPTPIESNYSRTGHRPGLVVQDLDDYSSNSGDEDAAAPSRRAAGRGRNTSLLEGRPLLRGISGDQLLTWLTTFLQRRSTHTSSVGDEAPQPLRGLADEVARRLRHSGGSRNDPQEVDAELVNRVEAYLAAKQNILDAHLAHVDIHRLARPASLHVVLHWQPLGGASSCAVPPSQSAPTRTRAATAGAPPLPLFMPEPEMDMMASVECFFASVADAGEDFPPLVAMAPDAKNNLPLPTPPSSTSSSWPPLAPTTSETVSCMIYATGRVQVSVPSMEVLRTVATAVLIPLLLCMADL